ncbi:cobaltochelatase subunit CobN [Pannonibacter sp. Pt2]|uniref:Cobaltochelatase subunit CobN n=1 Tax=Pannonibacter anstelovis TaxID=3121537 RepID=A0ABU7ZPL4_9HYPH
MHILASQTRRIDDGGDAVDLAQDPADLVFLSAADTELSAFAAAHASLGGDVSLRLASILALSHPYSVDLYAEKTLAGSKMVVLRLLGGAGYWSYGLDRLREEVNRSGLQLAVFAGCDKWDEDLAALSTVPVDAVRRLWRYCIEGGAENYRNALRFCAHLIGKDQEPPLPAPLPRAGIFLPGHTAPGLDDLTARFADPARPVAALVFYRALVQAGETAPAEALCRHLEGQGLNVLPIFVASLKDAESAAVLSALFEALPPAVVLNATAFAVSSGGRVHQPSPLDAPGRPVLQVVFSSSSRAGWAESTQGISVRDLAMHVVLPELDGRLMTRAVSFKEEGILDPATQFRPVLFRPEESRMAYVAALAANWAKLGGKPAAARKVALVLANYPDSDGRIANGVGLDTPASCAALIADLRDAGYDVPSDAPVTSEALMAHLLAGVTNSPQGRAGRRVDVRFALADYRKAFASFPEAVQAQVTARWGVPEEDPAMRDGAFHLPLTRFGSIYAGIQPARGYNIDPKATYHDPDLVPPHNYFAFYIWLREVAGVDAIVHLGKHGNLEWLPGKALALSEECYPEAVLGPVPNIYPFIVNDPGEGMQAKRRASAVIVDHLTPPLTRAENYGVANEMENLLDEYYLASGVDPRRQKVLTRDILELASVHGLDADIGLTPDMCETTRLARLDAHLCDLKELQIRDGLHVLGESPQGRLLHDLLVALVRVPRGSRSQDESLIRALARDLLGGAAEFDPLSCDFSALWTGPKPELLAGMSDALWRSCGDTVERLEKLAVLLVSGEMKCPELTATASVLQEIEATLLPAVAASGAAETAAVLAALDGRFVPPGPSGAPTRGRPDVLPTGRNFYSVDVRAVPTEVAWRLGQASAAEVALRYFQDEGEWPKALVLTCWGTANMRTGGDDIAQALALIGARPVWEPGSGRVTGFEIMPLSELRRPRIDVTLRISGFFRDAFPHQMDLFTSAVRAVAALDEPESANPMAARVRAERAELQARGLARDDAFAEASIRVFGSMPGAYGAGLQALMDEGIWQEREDFADAFLAWGSYAYGGGAKGEAVRERFETRLRGVDLVLHNQDNREHDLLDSDDYYQFEGGLAATVEALTGEVPVSYHTDHSRPERPVVRALSEEISRVVRGRAANPKWIAGVMRHGYKGAFEIAATLDYLFAFAATTRAVREHHFDQLYTAYIEDAAVREFLAHANPAAYEDILQRFDEAIRRGLWTPRRNSVHAGLSSQLTSQAMRA